MIAQAVQRADTSVSVTKSRPLGMLQAAAQHRRDKSPAPDTKIAVDRRPDSGMAGREELDTMVLNLLAIEAYLHRYTPLQRDRMMPYVRGLAAYFAIRAGARVQAEETDLGRRTIHANLQGVIDKERRSALAQARNIHQQQLKRLGDCTGDHQD